MNTKPTLAQKIFVAFMTASMVLGMCPLQAIADELYGHEDAITLENDDVTIVDGEPILGATEDEVAELGEPSGDSAASDEAASVEDTAISTMSTLATQAKGPENISVDGTEGSDWVYDEASDTITIKRGGHYKISRPRTWSPNHTTLIINANSDVTIDLTNVDLDARTLTDEEAKRLLFIDGEDGKKKWNPSQAYAQAMEDEDLKAKVTAQGRAGIEISKDMKYPVTLNLESLADNKGTEQNIHIYGGNYRAGIEKNNAAQLTINLKGRVNVYAGLGNYDKRSGAAAIGSVDGKDVSNIKIVGNVDMKNPGNLNAGTTTEIIPQSNDFGAAIGSGSHANVTNLEITGPDYDYYDESQSAMFTNVKGTSCQGSAIGAGYMSTGKSSVTIKGGAVNAMTYGYQALGSAVGVSVHYLESEITKKPAYGQAYCDVKLEDGFLNPQSYMGPGIVCGDQGTYTQVDGIVHVDGGYMSDFFNFETRDNAIGLYAKKVDIGSGMSDEAIKQGRDWAGYVSADTSFGIVALESMTFHKGMMNVFGSNYTNKVKNAQGIYTKSLIVEGGDLYSNSGILLEKGGELKQTAGILTSIGARSTDLGGLLDPENHEEDTPQKAAIGVEPGGGATISITNGAKCETLGGFDAGSGTITIDGGNTYVRAITGQLVGAKNESINLDGFNASKININNGKVIGFVASTGNDVRPSSLEGDSDHFGVDVRKLERQSVVAEGETGEDVVVAEPRTARDDASAKTTSSKATTMAEDATAFAIQPTIATSGYVHAISASKSSSGPTSIVQDNDDLTQYKWVEIGPELTISPYSGKEVTVPLSQRTASFKATTSPSNALVVYTSSDPEVLSFENENVGTATLHHAGQVDVTASPAGNYLGKSQSIHVIITKAELTEGTIEIADWTFGEPGNTPKFTSKALDAEDYDITYDWAPKARADEEDAYQSWDEVKPTAAGTYVARAHVPASADFSASAISKDFEIKKAAGTITMPHGGTSFNVAKNQENRITVLVKGDGDLTATNYDSNVVSVALAAQGGHTNGQKNGTNVWVVTVTPKEGATATSAQMTLHLDACDNFTESTSKPITLNLVDNVQGVDKPAAITDAGKLMYDGTPKVGYNTKNAAGHVHISGDLEATEPGTYTTIFKLDPGYKWNQGGGTEDVEVKWTITPKSLDSCDYSVVKLIENRQEVPYRYSGEEITPKVVLSYTPAKASKVELVEGVDYEIEGYDNNVTPGTAYIKVKAVEGSAHYTGNARISFQIEQARFRLCPSPSSNELVYNGEAQVPDYIFYNEVSGKQLELGKDYRKVVTNPNTVEAKPRGENGRWELYRDNLYFEGMGYYTSDKVTVNYAIKPAEMKDLIIQGVKATKLVNGSATPKITVVNDDGITIPETDYTVTYADNHTTGTGSIIVKGSGKNVTGEKTVTFQIYDDSNAPQVIGKPAENAKGRALSYNGQEQCYVEPGTGYTLSGTWKATEPGEYVAWATPNAGYMWNEDGDTSPQRYTWSIERIDLSKAKLEGIQDKVPYVEPVLDSKGNTPGITQNVKVTYDGYTLSNEDYYVTYENNMGVGTATLTVRPTADYDVDGKFGKEERYNRHVRNTQSAKFEIVRGNASVSSSIYTSVQIKDGRLLKGELPISVKADGTITVTSDDASIATGVVIDPKDSQVASGKAQALTALNLSALDIGIGEDRTNKIVQITPKRRGTTTLHVLVGNDGVNYGEASQTIYVNVYETVGGQKLVDKPIGLNLPYTGGSQVGVAYDAEGVELVSDYSGVAPNTYTAIVKPKKGYVWSDTKGTEEKEVPWSIVAPTSHLLAAVDENGSLITTSLDEAIDLTQYNLAEVRKPKEYRFTYQAESELEVSCDTSGVVELSGQTLTKDPTDSFYHLSVTPKKVGSTLITVKAKSYESDDIQPMISFYATVFEGDVSSKSVTVPEATFSYTGSEHVGIPASESYTLEGPSVVKSVEDGESAVRNVGASVGVNAGTYYVKVTPNEGYTWAGSQGRETRTVAWTITPANLASATITDLDTFVADGETMFYQENLKVLYQGNEVNPAEYVVSYDGDQKSPSSDTVTQKVIVTAAENRNFTDSKEQAYTITDPDAASGAATQVMAVSGTQEMGAQSVAAASESGSATIMADDAMTNDSLLSEQYYLGPYVDNSGSFAGTGTSTTTGTTGTTTSEPHVKTASGANLFEAWKAVADKLENGQREKVTVAVIDTGCLMNHPDLVPNLESDLAKDTYHDNYPVGANYMEDSVGHGTHVAGIIAAVANNEEGVAGASYNCKVLPIRSFDDYGYTTSEDLYQAFEYIEKLINEGHTDIKVINMSLGGYDWETEPESNDQLLLKKIETLRNEHDVLTIAAGGNGDANGTPITAPCFPSDFPNVLSVTSLNRYGADSSWSDYNIYKDVSAPGEEIVSTYLTKDYASLSGTSMATPLVSGIAALLYSVEPGASATDIENAIVTSGHKIENRGRRTQAMNTRHLSGNTVDGTAVYGQPVLAVDAFEAWKALEAQYGEAQYFMGECTVGNIPVQLYTGSAIEPKPTVTNKDGTVVDPSQYEITYENNTKVGTATIVITGVKGQSGDTTHVYRGTIRKSFEIKYDLASKSAIAFVEAPTSGTSGATELQPKVTYEGKVLTPGRDYTIEYLESTEAGTPQVVVKGKGDYEGTLTSNYKAGAGGTVQVPTPAQNLVYNGQEQIGVPESPNYTITSNTGRDAKTYTAHLTLKGDATWSDNSKGAKDIQWTIAPATPKLSASPSTIALNLGGSRSREVTVSYGGTGTLSVETSSEDVASVSTVANGKFTVTAGTKTGSTTITVKATAGMNYTEASLPIQVFVEGAEVDPTSSLPNETIKLDYASQDLTAVLAGDGYVLSDPSDGARIEDGNLIVREVGDYTVKATPVDYANYGTGALASEALGADGAKTITVQVQPIKAERLTITPVTGQVYTGSALTPPLAVTFKKGMAQLEAGKDYKATYTKNVNAGTAEVALDFAGLSKAYDGTRTVKFTIDKAQSSLQTLEPITIDLSKMTDGTQTFPVSYRDPAELTLDASGVSDFATVTLGKTGEGNAYELKVTPKNLPGAGAITITAPGDENHYGNSITAAFAVVQDTAEEPVVATDLSYTGAAQTGVKTGKGYKLEINAGSESAGAELDSQGNAVATNAGAYKVTAKLDRGFGWPDKSSGDKQLSFTISKAPSAITLSHISLSNNTLSLKTTSAATNVKVEALGKVWIDATQTDLQDVVSAEVVEVDGAFELQISAPSKTGTAKIVLLSEGDDNHSGATATLTVSVTSPSTGGGGGGGSAGGGGGGSVPTPPTPPVEESTEAEEVQQEVASGSTVDEVNKQAGDVATVTATKETGSTEEDNANVTWTIAIADAEAPTQDVAKGPVAGIVNALQKSKAQKATLVGNSAISINLDFASQQAIESFCQKCVDAALKAARSMANEDEEVAEDLAGTSFKLEISCSDGSSAIHTFRFTAPGVVPAGSVAVYRLYNQWSYEHLYTTKEDEKNELVGIGWTYENVAWYAPESGIGVYRLYNPYSYDHYYTKNKSEADGLVDLGWQWDNNANPIFYSVANGTNPVYQLFNPYEIKGTHFWTPDVNEYRNCQDQGWKGENAVFFATAIPETAK